jgi:2',3'-cyclic-nucleotide 2'-phosphodiesterase (5'-nucleotidase family)
MNIYRGLTRSVLCLVVWLLSTAADAASAKVTFVLVNDIYQMSATAMPDGKARGGFAALAAVVKAERASGRHVIVAHGGDTLSPSLMSSLDQGAHIMTLTNMIRPDIFAPGNHEFDFGKAVFARRIAEANFPVYAANLRGADGSPLPHLRDRSIVTIDGVRIGLTGAAYDQTSQVSSSGDLRFAPAVATMTEQADMLRREGADFVVAVVHADRPETLEMAGSRKIDLVLSGHNHDLFIEFDGRSAVVESSYDAHYVTIVDVDIAVSERDGRRSTVWWPQFRVIDTANVTPDPEVAAVVARYEAEVAQGLDGPIATTDVALDSRVALVRTQETTIGDLIADAMRARTNADAAVMNGGGIRGGRPYLPGTEITRRDVRNELLFDNRLVLIGVSGRELRAALENGVSRLPYSAGRFPQVSGIMLEVDASRPPGERIVSMRVDGAPLDPDRVYRVATNDFLASGNDGYVAFRNAPLLLPITDSPTLATEVMEYLRALGTVRSIAGGRIVMR